MNNTDSKNKKNFNELGLNKDILNSITRIGYKEPTIIQRCAIPYILLGRDLLGQAQTGTGKTAAFVLPIINNINLNDKYKLPQILVLTPTRELAIQVSEQFKIFSKHLQSINIACIYGGQDYNPQIKLLKNGAQIIIGTTGRIIDHIKRNTLKLNKLVTLVLDEADEMLKMGFIDDIKFILNYISESCQKLFFSATIPDDISHIIKKYLKNPYKIYIKTKEKTSNTLNQKFILIKGFSKINALCRLLETEKIDGVIIFVKTKNKTIEIANNLRLLNYKASAINGNMQQIERETIINQFKITKLNILVATDMVARGLDLERISHVFNYDMPINIDTYIHRIGRTGRAGREGTSISLVSIKEIKYLYAIEKFIGTAIKEIFIPSNQDIANTRLEYFKNKIISTLNKNKLINKYKIIITKIHEQLKININDLLATLTILAQNKKTLIPEEIEDNKIFKPNKKNKNIKNYNKLINKQLYYKNNVNFITYKLDVGLKNNVQPKNIVGAIANEGKINSKNICNISIKKDYTLVDLPSNLSLKVINHLKKVWVAGKKLNITIK